MVVSVVRIRTPNVMFLKGGPGLRRPQHIHRLIDAIRYSDSHPTISVRLLIIGLELVDHNRPSLLLCPAIMHPSVRFRNPRLRELADPCTLMVFNLSLSPAYRH
jgi:hypothetical protein